MGKYDKEYDAFQIFEQIQESDAGLPLPVPQSQPLSFAQSERISQPLSQPDLQPEPVQPNLASTAKPAGQVIREEAPYYEIEYDSSPWPGVGKFVMKSDKIEAPTQERDETREIFNQMRDIARESRYLHFSSSKFYDRKIQQENARIFYRQGMFMKDFEDEYERILPYSAYFPNYQMMGYGQLRTYFTWRTQVRQGNIQQTSLSYAFLYIYELLNNIGVEDPREGLDRLILFWDVFRVYDQSIDKYVLKWLKDYHIYYGLPLSFREFIQENGLGAHYPDLTAPEDTFDLYCAISKYDIRKSNFYTDERKELVRDCFAFLMDRLQQVFAESHLNLEESIFQPTKRMSLWIPFKDALFYPALRQADRRVVLSEKEIYLCAGNQWTFSTSITTESGKQLLGYAFKQMESVLRSLTKYRHKLTANVNSLSPVMADELRKEGISLEAVITDAVREFYREATKTVVKVDQRTLEKIRREALDTQEKLIVPEQEPVAGSLAGSLEGILAGPLNGGLAGLMVPEIGGDPVQAADSVQDASQMDDILDDSLIQRTEIIQDEEQTDSWDALKDALTETEKGALALVINGGTDIKKFADAHGVMLEVLMDGINEKSMDYVGDSLLDDEFMIYEDYIDQVKGMVESI